MNDEQKDIAQHMREWYEVFRRHGKGDERSVKVFLEAADLIEHLSSVAEKASAKAALCEKVMEDYDKMRRERDAAADDIELGVCCETCKHDNDDDEGVLCVGCVRVTSRGNWEWRGVKSDAE